MKKISTWFFIIAVIFSLAFVSCKKYPEGPSFTLQSKKARIANSWMIEQYKYNGADSTAVAKSNYFVDYNLTISKNGNYSFSYTFKHQSLILPVNETGKWVFGNNKKDVIFTKEDGNTNVANGQNSTWQILRLAEKEFWAKYTQDNDVIEVHFN